MIFGLRKLLYYMYLDVRNDTVTLHYKSFV